jgi:HAE1 family hydrophobic/amphiphilic exporter-1
VVVFSLLMSLFVAVTLVPVLCSLLMTPHDAEKERTGVTGWLFTRSGALLDGLDNKYAKFLGVALRHRPTVLAFGASVFALSVFLFPYLKFELMPQTDEGEVRVDIELPVGTRVEQTQAAILEVEDKIRKVVPELVTLISQGGGGGFMGGASTHRGDLTLTLKPKAERTRSNEQIAQDLRRQLTGIPGVIARSRASGGSQLNRVLGGNQDARLSLEIRGYDFDDATRLVTQSEALLRTVPGIADVRRARQDGRPELAVRVDRDKAAIFGLSVTGVADTLRTNVAGTQAAFYRERGQEYPIVVRLRQEDRAHITDVGDVLVSAPGNRVIPARSLLTVEPENSPVEIERKNQERISRVNAELEVSLSEAVANVEKRLPELEVPGDFQVGFGAELEEQIKAFTQLKYLLILAVILVYAVMASQYESFRDPFIIMFSIPLATIGVVGALLLTNTTFSLQAYIGVIMLAGIVVSNAILLVDYTSTLRHRDGMELFEAAVTAGRTRLRPIVMTTLTTILGLVPMAFEIGEGAELQAPLARVVIGGLLASTLITLVFVPTVYTLFEQGFKSLRRKSAVKATEPGDAVARVDL